METKTVKTSECKFEHLSNGRVAVIFVNYVTGEIKAKEYKNASAAQAQVTKFQNRMARIYK